MPFYLGLENWNMEFLNRICVLKPTLYIRAACLNSPCYANHTQVSTRIPNPYHTVSACNRVSRLTFIGLNVETCV